MSSSVNDKRKTGKKEVPFMSWQMVELHEANVKALFEADEKKKK